MFARPSPGRRSVLGAAGAVAAGAALAGCGAASSMTAGPQTVRFWNLFSGGDGALMQTILAEVKKREPDLQVESTVLAWGSPYYTKLAMASAGGRAPETAIMHLSRLAGYAPGGLLDPWDLDLLAEFGVTPEKLNPAAWKRTFYQGKPYAIPLDTHPFVVFFDRDVMDRAGLLQPDGKLVDFGSPEGFLEAAKKLRRTTKGGLGPVFGHTGDAAQNWRLFWGLFRQTGAEFDLSGKKAKVDRAAATRVVKFMADLVAPDCRTYDYGTAIAKFTGRQSAMILTGEWELTGFKAAKLPALDGAPFPTLFGHPANYADSHSFILPHQNNPDPARRRAAHRFVAAVLKSSMTWAQAGHIPAYQPVVNSAPYKKLLPQAHYAQAGKEAAIDPGAWFTGAGSDFQNRMCQAMEGALSGGEKPAAAVDAMVAQLDTLLSKPNPA